MSTTTLETANIKLSGKYKIVVDINNKLHLDDYNNNRKEIDINNDLLLQVSNFLQTPTQIVDPSKLNYGFTFNDNLIKFHVPMYIDEISNLPTHCLIGNISEIPNTEPNDLNNFNLIKTFDLDKINVLKLLESIVFDNTFDHLTFLNLDQTYIELNGYDITSNTYTNISHDSNEFQTKLTDTDDLSNYIYDLFEQNNLINPRFINIEFEYLQPPVASFNLTNYFGFLSKSMHSDEILTNHVNIDNYTNQQINELTLIPNTTYLDLQHEITNYVENIETEAYINLNFNNILIGDEIVFRRCVDDVIIFKYKVSALDIDNTINATLNNIARNIDFDSVFIVERFGLTGITFFSNLFEDVYVEVPKHVDLNVANGKFITKNVNDIVSFVDIDIDAVEIEVNGISYPVDSKFVEIVNGREYHYYSLNVDNRSNVFEGKNIKIFERINQSFISFKNIQHSDYGINIKYNENSNRKLYVSELLANFPDHTETINDFEDSILNYVEPVPFVDVNNDIGKTEISLNSLTQVSGTTSYGLPNVLNYDKQFYVESQQLIYHWFLINSEPPTYIVGDAKNRFVGDKLYDESGNLSLTNIKLKSKLKLSNKNDLTCECIFLGVRYLMDYTFSDYDFAVVHMPSSNINNNNSDNYTINVNRERREIILTLNKFLLFVDLIRGGNLQNKPLIDLSLYYTVDKLYTSNLDDIGFLTRLGGLLLADENIPVLFGNSNFNIVDNWRIQTDDAQYICLKNNILINSLPLSNFLPNSGDVEFFHYNFISDIGRIIAIKFKLINIVELTNDYVWCENVLVSFFETENNYFNVNNVDIADFKKVETIDIIDATKNQIEVTAKINGENIKLIFDPNKSLNFKEDYFECGVNDINNIFKFSDSTLTDQEILDKLYNGIFVNGIPENNNKYLTQKINLFHRNQLWLLSKTIMATSAQFKFDNFDEVRRNIKDLTVDLLRLYSDINLISDATGDNKYKLNVSTKDTGLAHWNNKITRIQRNRALFKPYFTETNLSNYNILTYSNDIILDIFVESVNVDYYTKLQTFLDDNNANINVIEFLDIYYMLLNVSLNNKRIDYKISNNSRNDIILDSKFIGTTIQFTFIKK